MVELRVIIKFVNIVLGGALIFFGVYDTITLAGLSIGIYNFFMPIFFAIFGFILIGFEFKKELVQEHFKFMQTLIGRGLFYIFLASLTVLGDSDESDSGKTMDIINYIYGCVLFLLGILYIVLHLFAGDDGKLHDIKQDLMEGQEENNDTLETVDQGV